jgi:two-component system nitrate/nitrite response regulator NarL
MEASTPFYRTVSVCETQPLTIRGLKNLLEETPDFRLGSWHGTVAEWMMSSLADQTDILIIDKALGAQVLLDALAHIPASGKKTAGVVIWGVSLNEAEALRLLQAGARGILRKSAELDAVLACLRMVAQGGSWMQDTVFRESGNVAETHLHTELTPREQQVLELVEQGFKNREIAAELGIRPGTVKIHLKHIFEKTGIHGRHGLALTGLRQKGVIPRMIS